MKISVITATFNSEKSLEATIESFKSQTYPNKELVIVDAGSTDKTTDIIHSHEKDIAKWVSEPDQGIYDALNKGIGMADGEIIGFLHSGDRFPNSEVLEKIAGQFNNSSIQAVYGDLRYIHPKKPENVIRYWQSGKFTPDLLNKGWMPPHPSLYLKREVYVKHGLFNLNFRIASDYDLMLRVLKDTSIEVAYLPEIIVDMETGGISNGKLINIIRKSYEDFIALRNNRIPFALWVLTRKNFRKIPQFFS